MLLEYNLINVLLCTTIEIFEPKKKKCLNLRSSLLYHGYIRKAKKQLLKSYGPISLTNTDYKITACVLPERLQKILTYMYTINKNQTIYLKGRYIGENARLILDIFEYCNSENKDGILLFLDFEKPFDYVEWNFLFETLNKKLILTIIFLDGYRYYI